MDRPADGINRCGSAVRIQSRGVGEGPECGGPRRLIAVFRAIDAQYIQADSADPSRIQCGQGNGFDDLQCVCMSARFFQRARQEKRRILARAC